jgi:RHS repeat-associated protein
MPMPDRKSGNQDYRFSFQGQEKDDEIKGQGNSLNYEYRMHDPRIGRFFAVDPLEGSYPWNSPYAFSENMVIHAVELEGLEAAQVNVSEYNQNGDQVGGREYYDNTMGTAWGTLSNYDVNANQYPKGSVVTVYVGPDGDTRVNIIEGGKVNGYHFDLEQKVSNELQSKGISNNPENVARVVGYYNAAMDFIDNLPEDSPWYYDLNNAISSGGHEIITAIVDEIPLYQIAFGLYGENARGEKLSNEDRMIYVLSGSLRIQKAIVARFFRGKGGQKNGSKPALRNAYEDEVRGISKTADEMRSAGFGSQEIAYKVHGMRRNIGMKYKDLTPSYLRNVIYDRNIKNYGDPLGPSIKWLRQQGKTWDQIIESASKPGGADFGY